MYNGNFTDLLTKTGEVGFVQQLRSKSLVLIEGLPGVHQEEIVVFENGVTGLITGLSENFAEVLLLSDVTPAIGAKVARTNTQISVPVSENLLGKTVNPLCQNLTDSSTIEGEERQIEQTPLGISSRAKIKNALETGVSLVDLLVPLGQGQRELVIGDRKTGKSSFLLQTVLKQAAEGTICIYSFIGKKMADIQQFQKALASQETRSKVIVVATAANDAPGLIYLTPFTAITIAEYFRDLGKNTLVIFDDMTTHAKFYREYCLTARKFPGRESYPGDIFYLHSRLLERAGSFETPKGTVSISALPVAESYENDITGFIQTNLMSMVDGHLFFDSDFFVKGRRPAINPFLSVSRVGRQTQSQITKDINREISVVLTSFEKSSELSHFGSTLVESLKLSLKTGEKIWAFLDQNPQTLLDSDLQIMLFSLLWLNYIDYQGKEALAVTMTQLAKAYQDDEKIRYQTKEMIAKSSSFNILLGAIQENSAEIKSKFKL